MKKVFVGILTAAVAILGFASCVKNEDPPPPPGASGFKGKLYINEVNGWQSDDPDKNFELYNATDQPISLEGFYLVYTEERETWRGRAEDVIPAKGYKLIQGARVGYPGFETGLSNRNPNVYLTFFDDKGLIIDHYEKIPDLRGTSLEFMCHARIPDGGKWYYILSGMATPGTANPTAAPDGAIEMPSMERGLTIELVSVTPASPTPDNDVTIIVRVTDVNPITSVILEWEKDGTKQADIIMTKDGDNYTATIPKQADGTLVEWTIEATNNKGVNVLKSGTITFTAPITGVDYSKLKLNEVSGVGDDADKFYELINIGNVEIPLAGCKIYYNANSSNGGEFPPNGNQGLTWTGNATHVIQPGGLLLLQGRYNATSNPEGAFTTGLTSQRILIITLEDPDGNSIDECIRAKDTDEYAIAEHSFSRIPDGIGPFYFTTPTPNVTNGTATAGLKLVPVTP